MECTGTPILPIQVSAGEGGSGRRRATPGTLEGHPLSSGSGQSLLLQGSRVLLTCFEQSFYATSQGYKFTFASAFLPTFEQQSSSPSRKASILRHVKRPTLETDDDASDLELELELSWGTDPSFLLPSSVSEASEPEDSCPASPEPSSDFEIETVSLRQARIPSLDPPDLRKRNVDQVQSTSAPSGPAKKKSKAGAATTKAQEPVTKGGIMGFFAKCTKEERDEEVQRYSEKIKIKGEEEMEILEAKKRVIGAKEREGARLRKEKSRKRERDGEIATGKRSPGGTKRKVSPLYHLLLQLLMSMG